MDYYINNGSRVYCKFLDASKAFDHLVHSGLFMKMIDKKCPKTFIDVIITWYDGLYCRVLWDGAHSSWFFVSAGDRQGGVLSPNFYGLYVDDLFRIPHQSSGAGCYYVKRYAAALMYTDDMAVLAPFSNRITEAFIPMRKLLPRMGYKVECQKIKKIFGLVKVSLHRLI